jgi:L-malate glycosyltransferase
VLRRFTRRYARRGGVPAPRRVVIIQKNLAHYRGPFYEQLRSRLNEDGIELCLIYGQASGSHASRNDTIDIPWGTRVHNHPLALGSRELLWQPILSYLKQGDLVIVEQAAKLLVNYVLLARHSLGWIDLAFWGHGQNLDQGRRSRLGESVKVFFSRHAHWWFAYTKASAALVARIGFPSERITIVQNAIDSASLREARDSLDPSVVEGVRNELAIQSDNLAIFCGGLYPEKRLEFLIKAADIVRQHIPDFELVVLGAGPDEEIVAEAARNRIWLHQIGPVFGADAAPYFSMARVMLIPGWTGLSIVDSFVYETPMITVDGPQPPEIEYLEHGVNGLILPATSTPAGYAEAVVRVLTDRAERERLITGCRQSAGEYTIQRMAENFAQGIREALA